ncbi:hypothetical protein LCL89_05290 [Halobacillus yeomjeoni]|uniref:hypothetical protein n=1 Tax=Halobacillus yeomjeoni TaxID=311194 RepID=UPI001CD74213|nr:hypothetical protein [Halobacillus yeomjeoni]MCA0983466.1 hypothetical protein [Halobacillus yeomjeoni]
MKASSSYEKLNNEMLISFYHFLLTNIYSGNLSKTMLNETSLLEITAKRRGIYLTYFKKVVHPKNPFQILIVIQQID